MLTSKPPFQSSTTDEIYRRARDRDYEWPDPETTQKFISGEAKDLVASMLESPESRPDPDSIVQHPWFRVGYMPVPADITPRLRELPPERSEFYMDELTEEQYKESLENLRTLSMDCMVGPYAPVQVIHSQVWKEMAAEEKACLTPMIPLAEGIVYRPFDEWLGEQPQSSSGRVRRLLPSHQQYQQQQQQPPQQIQAQIPQKLQTVTEDLTTKSGTVPTGLLRQPPQSFAAQQRAQGRPAAVMIPRAPPPTSATSINSAASTPMAPPSAVKTSMTTASTVSRQRGVTSERTQQQALETIQREELRLGLRSRPRREGHQVAAEPLALRSRSETIPRIDSEAPTRTKLPSSSGHTRAASSASAERQTLTRETQSAPATVRGPSTPMIKSSLFSPLERTAEVAGTQPDIILSRLQRLQTELERALNARTMAIITSKTVAPPHPQVVVKWVDYTNKFGLGYILNDGSIGCVLREIATPEGSKAVLLPPACMVIQNSERHVQLRQDERYADRHQPVPMNRNIHFFENRGEAGLAQLTVSPEEFRVPVGDNGVPAKLGPGSDAYQYRKRERIILWKKFANYMIAYGRDDGVAGDASPLKEAMPSGVEEIDPAQVVIFYQRFGDVGCWVFCDGHLQVRILLSCQTRFVSI